MPAVHVNPGPMHVALGGGQSVSFRPNGKVVFVDSEWEANPARKAPGGPTVAARFLVGFNVGGRKRWKMRDLIALVTKLRRQQGHDPDSSFVAQKGVYTSRTGSGTVVEDGAQVFILNFGSPVKTFTAEMIRLGETLAKKLQQELVICEMQRGGVTTATYLITAS